MSSCCHFRTDFLPCVLVLCHMLQMTGHTKLVTSLPILINST